MTACYHIISFQQNLAAVLCMKQRLDMLSGPPLPGAQHQHICTCCSWRHKIALQQSLYYSAFTACQCPQAYSSIAMDAGSPLCAYLSL